MVRTRRDAPGSLSMVDFHDPYKEARLRGRVVERYMMAIASS
jgi:hypothetical protein